MKFLTACLLVTGASAKLLKKNTVPAGEVFMSDAKIFGAGASGTVPAIGECQSFSQAAQTSKSEPRVKVCGSTIKVTAFLKNDCQDYKTVTIGACDGTKAASHCEEVDPKSAPQAGFEHFQSYKIEYCSA